jgi:zinc protease
MPYRYGCCVGINWPLTLAAVEEVVLREIDHLCAHGITPDELKKVHAQLRARFVYDGDSVTDIAHQIGYFETIASWSSYHGLRARLDAVTIAQVQAAAAKYLAASNRTIGWFEPQK